MLTGEAKKEYQKEYMRAKRSNNSGDNQAGEEQNVRPETIKDCTDNECKIDYASRKEYFLKVLDWAEGKGDEYQCRLGNLSCQYTKGSRINIAEYLGIEKQDADILRLRLDAVISKASQDKAQNDK